MNLPPITLAIIFNDEPNVVHFIKFMGDFRNVPLSMNFNHPRLGVPVKVIFRGVSSQGKSIYSFREGTRAGEVLGG